MVFSKSVIVARSFLMITVLASLAVASQSIVVTNTEQFYKNEMSGVFDFELDHKSSLPSLETLQLLLKVTFPDHGIVVVNKTSKSENGSFGQMFTTKSFDTNTDSLVPGSLVLKIYETNCPDMQIGYDNQSEQSKLDEPTVGIESVALKYKKSSWERLVNVREFMKNLHPQPKADFPKLAHIEKVFIYRGLPHPKTTAPRFYAIEVLQAAPGRSLAHIMSDDNMPSKEASSCFFEVGRALASLQNFFITKQTLKQLRDNLKSIMPNDSHIELNTKLKSAFDSVSSVAHGDWQPGNIYISKGPDEKFLVTLIDLETMWESLSQKEKMPPICAEFMYFVDFVRRRFSTLSPYMLDEFMKGFVGGYPADIRNWLKWHLTELMQIPNK